MTSTVKARGHGIYLNQGPHDAGLSECGPDTSKACRQENAVQAFFSFIP